MAAITTTGHQAFQDVVPFFTYYQVLNITPSVPQRRDGSSL
jgi:hypothetical protein